MNIGRRLCRIAVCSAAAGMVFTPAALAQTNLSPTQTTLTSNSPTLILPGSLTLTSVVSSGPGASGVPTGPVEFYFDGNQANNLGDIPLKMVPGTQKFVQMGPFSTTGATPACMVSAPLSSASSNLDMVVDGQSGNGPAFILYPGLGNGQIDTANPQTYPISSPPNGLSPLDIIDSMAVGSFTAPGSIDVVAHSYNLQGQSFYSLLSKQTNGTLAASTSTLPYTFSTSAADYEKIALDDFDGDGLSDVAYIVPADHFGVSLNSRATPGKLGAPSQLYVAALMLPGSDTLQNLCPTSLATGKFTASGHADFVMTATQCISGSASQGYVLLFPGDGAGGFGATTPTEIGLDVTPPTYVQVGTNLVAMGVGDFNKDGNLDVVVADDSDSTLHILYGNGDGTFKTAIANFNLAGIPTALTVQDFNGDGFPDVAVTLNTTGALTGAIAVLYNDGKGTLVASSQTFATTTAGVAILNGDFNSDGYPDIAVLTATNNAAAVLVEPAFTTLVSTASAQAVLVTAPLTLPAGSHTVTAAYFSALAFAGSTSDPLQETVTQTMPLVSWVAPAPIVYGTPLSNAQLNAASSIPGKFTYTPSTGTVLPPGSEILSALFTPTDLFDYTSGTRSQTLEVTAPTPVASATGPSTISVTQQSTVTLAISPYPGPVTVTATISFIPAAPNTVPDPTVLFSNGSTTISFDLPALDANAIPPIAFQSGSSAGTITITVQLTAGGVNISPASLTPIEITVPAAPPEIGAVTLTRNGKSLQLAITGLSSTREITQAQFHFVPASGQSLSTTDITVPLTTVFNTWYQSETSTPFGTQFLYTQPFTLDTDASTIGSVIVTLTNSQGASAPSNAQ
jgi:hypothetical protein